MDASQTSLFTSFLILFVVVGAIIAFFILSMIRQQRRNVALYKSKLVAEITTMEKERQRVAADLHDELGPILAAVKFKIGSLEVSREDEELVETINHNIDELVTRMRNISHDLLPKTLLRKGLLAAVEESIQMIRRKGMLEITLIRHELPELDQSRAVNLYRILQEIIHNTIRHAAAKTLKIEVKVNGKMLEMLTEDDGRGFDHEAMTREARGLGLRNMLSRTEMLGGNMYIESGAGKGTRYSFEIPLS